MLTSEVVSHKTELILMSLSQLFNSVGWFSAIKTQKILKHNEIVKQY